MNIDRLKESREDKDYKQIDIAKYLKVDTKWVLILFLLKSLLV